MKNIVSSFLRTAALFLFACLFVASGTLRAADSNPPDRLTYQGYLVDGNGFALATNAPKNYDVVFRIYDSQSAGNLKWSEQQTVTVDKGYFSILLGEGSQVGSEPHASLATTFYATDASDRFVQMTVKGIGVSGADVDILPRLRMMTAPYAYLAKNAVNSSTLVNSTNNQIVTVAGTFVGINKTIPTSALDVNGTVTATAFSGNGASLTSLNAGNVTSGTLADARLTANVGLLNGSQTYSGRPIFNAGLTLNSSPLYIRGDADANHTLKWVSTFGGVGSMDGPALTGYGSGVLGIKQGATEYPDLVWNSQGVYISGQPANSPTASTAYNLAQQLTIYGRDLQPSAIRMTMGMCQVNNVEYTGVMQAYSSASGAANLKLNPVGGSVSTGPGNFSVNGPTFLNSGFTATGDTVFNGRISQNSGFDPNILTIMKSTGQYYLLWLYGSSGSLDYSFGSGGAALKTGGGSFGALSDIRVKHNVQDLSNALNKLLELRSVTFEYNEPKKYGEGTQIGFVAQEVEKVFPNWVGDAPDKMKAVFIKGFESLTVQALRELRSEKDAQVRKLEEENKSLRAQLDSQDKRLSKLEKLQALLEKMPKDKAAGN